MDKFEVSLPPLIDNLYAAALQLTSNHAEAETLVCATYRASLTRNSRPDSGAALKLSMFVVLYELERSRARAAGDRSVQRQERTASANSLTSGDANGWTQEVTKTGASTLQVAFRLLLMDLRHAVWLRDVEGFSYAEIALILDADMAIVPILISRGRRLLREPLLDVPLRCLASC